MAAPALAWEAAIADLLRDDYVPTSGARDVGYDLTTHDHQRIIQLKFSVHGSRDLDAALMHLVRILAEFKDIQRATLVARFPRMGVERVRNDWQRALGVLRPEIARRLALVALAADRDTAIPEDDADVQRIMTLARRALHGRDVHNEMDPSLAQWSPKLFEVWKVLLDAWLRCEGPVPIQEIARRSGCSHPTVSVTLGRLQARGELERTRNRSAGMSAFPRRSLGEFLILADGLRQTVRFVDGSGRRPDPTGLLRRVTAMGPTDVGIGGVAAARHYVTDFDLHGLPRVDVSLPARYPLAWVASIDPALRPARHDEPSSVLVVHRLFRPDARFDREPSGGLLFADPAEALLDLYDLRLTTQAEDFAQAMRQKGHCHG